MEEKRRFPSLALQAAARRLLRGNVCLPMDH